MKAEVNSEMAYWRYVKTVYYYYYYYYYYYGFIANISTETLFIYQ